MKCLLCFEDTATEFLNLGRQPLANKYPKTEADFAREDFFPLAVFFCINCKNVQLGTVVSRERMFEDYYYLSSVNPGLVRHFEQLAKELAGAKFVVDIGSNDGILLKPLKEMGVRCLGVDPSINVGKIANDAGLETIIAFFDEPTAKQIARDYGKPDVVVASSIFTHIEDPHDFIKALKILMDEDGKFILEVEYIGNFVKKVQFERFYLDRIFYYSLSSIKNLFEKYDMVITDVEEIEPHGGSLRVIIKNKGDQAEVSGRVTEWLKKEAEELTLENLKKFRDEVDSQIKALGEKLEEYKRSGLKVAGYGAPARVTTITNYGEIGPDLISFLVDDSPLKQNKFSPGKHIPIVSNKRLEEEKPDALVVFAYEYFDDIKKKVQSDYRFLMPIPPKEIS
jgi:hypothetical protein